MSKFRSEMPIVAGFLQSLIDNLTGEISYTNEHGQKVVRHIEPAVMANHIRAGLRGEVQFYAEENGHVIGQPMDQSKYKTFPAIPWALSTEKKTK